MNYALLQAAHTLVEVVQAKGLLGALLLLAAALAGTLLVRKRSRDREGRAGEARTRAILDAAPDAIVAVDKAGRIVLTNAAAVSLFGFSQEELMGMPVETLVPRSLAERHTAHRARFSADPKARPMGLGLELAAVRKDGTSIPVDISLSHVRMGDDTTVLAAIRDVTERKNTEEALRHSEARLRALTDVTFAVVWHMNPSGQPVGENASWRDFTGQTEGDMRDGRWIEAVHPDDRGLLSAVVFRATARAEARLRRLDGEWRHMVVRSAPIRDADGEVQEWIGAAVDVTERKRAEETLRESEQRLRAVLNNAPITIFAVDEQGMFTLSEGKGLEKVGLKPGENVGVSAMELYDTLSIIQPDGSTINGLDARSRVMAGETVAGVTRLNDEYLENQMVPDRDAAGRVIGMIGIATNITERMQVQAALQANEQRLRVSLSGIDMAVFQQDLALRYTWMFQPQLGYESAGVIGHTDAELLPPEPARRVTEIKRRVLETGESARAEVIITAEGATVAYDLTVEPLRDGGGAITGLTGASLDITDRRQAQASLEESQKELRALAAHLDAVREEERATLGRNLHDDLGQALTALKMDVRALRRRVAKGGKMSPASLDPMDELVDGLIATGRQVVSELHAPLLEGLTLRDSVELQAAEFIRRTRIHCDVTCTSGDLSLDDRMALLLYRIVQESLTNVARHAAATAVTIAIRAAGDDLVLLVEDNGRGIAAERSAGGRFGIIGMRERALALGGRFAIRGGVHGGTVVEVVVPFRGHDAVEGGA